MMSDSVSFDSDRPQIKVLSQEKIERIHEASLGILSNTGVSVRLPEAVELLASAGCDVIGDMVKIPRRVVEESLNMVPNRITVYDRLRNEAMQLEGRNPHFGTGPTIQYVIDPETGERRDSTMEDIEQAARIVDYLPNLDFCMTMGMSGGVNPQIFRLNPLVTDRFDFAAMLRNTTKPLMFSNWSLAGLQDCYQMALAARDGDEDSLREKPFIMVYCEPTTPLIHDHDPLELALFCAEKSIPVLNISGPVAGGSSPVTLAGSLVLANTELLSALVISQLKNKGAPMVYGGSAGPLDMRTGVCIYSGPECWLNNIAVKDLATFYNLPDFNTAAASDAKVLDLQAGVDYTAGIMQAILAGSNLIHDVGYMESGYTASWEGIVLADEIIDFMKSFLKGIPVDEDTLALDAIKNQGAGGSFIADQHTFDHFRYIWQPKLFDRGNRESWEAAGSNDLGAKLNEKVKEILSTHVPEPLNEAAQNQVASILDGAKAQYPADK